MRSYQKSLPTTFQTNSLQLHHLTHYHPTRLALLRKPKQTLLVRLLNPTELQERPDKGFCYTCNEKFFPGHKCKNRFFLLVHQDETSILSVPIYPNCYLLFCFLHCPQAVQNFLILVFMLWLVKIIHKHYD